MSTAMWHEAAWIMLPLERGRSPLVWVAGRPYMPESSDLTYALEQRLSPIDVAQALDTIRSVVARFERT